MLSLLVISRIDTPNLKYTKSAITRGPQYLKNQLLYWKLESSLLF